MPNPKGNLKTLKKYQPKWKSGDTRTIRVPIALVDQILNYAHQLDEAVDPTTKIDSNHLSQVKEVSNSSDESLKVINDPTLNPTLQPVEETVHPTQLSQNDSIRLTQVINLLEEVGMTPRNNFSREKKGLLRRAISELKSLSQVND